MPLLRFVHCAPVLASGHPVDTVPTIGLNVKVQLSWPFFPPVVAMSAIRFSWWSANLVTSVQLLAQMAM